MLEFFNRLPRGSYTGRINGSTSLLTTDILDSLLIQDLLVHIEDRFGVSLPPEEIRPETFATPKDIARLIEDFMGRATSRAMASGSLELLNTLAESQGLTRHWLEIPGGRLHRLSTSGPGPALILLPGLGSPASSWSGFMASLVGRRTAHALDLAGFGVSTIEDSRPLTMERQVELTLEVLHRVVPSPWVLIGHSAGAMVAAEVARRAPAQTQALVCISFGPVRDARGWWHMLRQLAEDPDGFWQRAFHFPPPLTDALRQQLAQTFSSAAYQDFLDEGALALLPRALDGLRLPTLILGGSEDGIMPAEALAEGAGAIPGARLAWLARCGHFAHAEHPQELLVYVEDFLQSLHAGQSGM